MSIASVLRLTLPVSLIASAGCRMGPGPRIKAPVLDPFVAMARGSGCAESRNRLFLIDRTLVFWDRAGNCPDNGYGETLFGGTPDEILCALHDSIAGPMKTCRDTSHADLFEI